MNQALVDKIVKAVLYEGYILYPYRPSVKNRQRWTFGGVYPRSYSEAQSGSDGWSMQTECLVRGGEHSILQVKMRFLHLLNRWVRELDRPPGATGEDETPGRIVDSLQIGNLRYQTWQEASEREVALPERDLASLCRENWRTQFVFPGSCQREQVRDAAGEVVAIVEREQQPVVGAVEVRAEQIVVRSLRDLNSGRGATGPYDALFKLRVRIENLSPLDDAYRTNRDEALRRSLISTHTILGVRDGEFVSLIDPPEKCREAAAGCHNIGTWPVLVGESGQRDTMLSSPIVLYDFPEVAPESPGDLFDATEIDEILSLRILTLTDEEKQSAAAVDDRVRALLQRTETLDDEQFLGLHGVLRQVRPVAGGLP